MIKSRGVLRFLKIFHLITTSIWFGGVVCISALVWFVFFHLSESDFLVVAPMVQTLYQKAVLPASLLTLAQGLIYGFFTNWGFFKQKWITIKWISVLLLVFCTGFGAIGQMFAVIGKVQTSGLQGGYADGGTVMFFMAAQCIILAIMVLLSVIKPFRGKQGN